MNPSIEEAMHMFYDLRQKYTMNRKTAIISAKKVFKTKNGRQNAIREIQPRCVSCRNIGGTVFQIVPDPDTGTRTFTAKCNASPSCGLYINFTVGNRSNVDITEQETWNDLQQGRVNIIQDKSNALFLLDQSSVEDFEEHAMEVKELSDMYEHLQDYVRYRKQHPEQIQQLNEAVDLFSTKLSSFQNYIHAAKTNDSVSQLNEAIKYYFEEILPMAKKLQSMKYDVTLMDVNLDGKVRLVQTHMLHKNEYWYPSDDKVHSVQTGVMRPSKTVKRKPQATTRKKTAKPKKSPKPKKKPAPPLQAPIMEGSGISSNDEPADVVEEMPSMNENAFRSEPQEKSSTHVPSDDTELKEIDIQDIDWSDNGVSSKDEDEPSFFALYSDNLERGAEEDATTIFNSTWNALTSSVELPSSIDIESAVRAVQDDQGVDSNKEAPLKRRIEISEENMAQQTKDMLLGTGDRVFTDVEDGIFLTILKAKLLDTRIHQKNEQ